MKYLNLYCEFMHHVHTNNNATPNFYTPTVKFQSQIRVTEFHFYFELFEVRHLLGGRYEPQEKKERIPVRKCGWTKGLTWPHFVCVDLYQKSLQLWKDILFCWLRKKRHALSFNYPFFTKANSDLLSFHPMTIYIWNKGLFLFVLEGIWFHTFLNKKCKSFFLLSKFSTFVLTSMLHTFASSFTTQALIKWVVGPPQTNKQTKLHQWKKMF